MKIHQCAQGTPQWSALRAGIPTASAFNRILTPGGKPCKADRSEEYMHSLLAERLMGHPVIDFKSSWMDRGTEQEGRAVSFYEFQRDLETVKVGFMTNDDETIGASPDRTVGDEGLLEIKVPKESTHVYYLLKRGPDADYWPQVQGQLWISERKWLDILSYHPEMPPALIRVERDEEYISKLSKAVAEFSRRLESEWVKCIERGWVKEPVKNTVDFSQGALVKALKDSLAQINGRPA